ncbi:hypothetical protein V7068_18450 [Bacillus sp. JJ634]
MLWTVYRNSGKYRGKTGFIKVRHLMKLLILKGINDDYISQWSVDAFLFYQRQAKSIEV